MQAKAYARSSEFEKQNNDRSIIAVNNTAAAFDHQWLCAHQCDDYYSRYYNEETLSADVALKLLSAVKAWVT